jgi:hypothetical protein
VAWCWRRARLCGMKPEGFAGGGEATGGQTDRQSYPMGDVSVSILFNILLLALVFVVLKSFQLVFDFGYTTYKSVTIHKNWEHAFNPGLGYRLKRGLYGDMMYFVAGIVVALNADAIRGLIVG